jgi:ABC-type polysaccharide/polyol phosphate transport system ATPase subunit
MSQVTLNKVCVDFPLYGMSRNLRFSFLAGLTGGKIFGNNNKKSNVFVKALEDICLDLKSGDRVGLIGHNGAGKSTLLRVLGGIYTPTSGDISLKGKITPLLHQSPGLEMEDSGLENIITCGLLLGMSIDEVSNKVDQIIEFSDLGDYIHLPVRTYSSGMLSRLSFSIATSIDPGILLLDEGIGAADARFSEKAAKRVKELIDRTDILVLASHSDALIDSMCNKAILMHHGRMLEFGPVAQVVKSYKQLLQLNS